MKIYSRYCYLLEVNRIPLTPPKVDMATNTGIKKAKWPNILCAKVWNLQEIDLSLKNEALKFLVF